MVNNAGARELAYLALIDKIEPIPGSDNCEAAYIGGWHVMVRKGEFKSGDLAVFFEPDSMVDAENPVFAFLEKKKYIVKEQKYTFGGKGLFYSTGLIMRPEDFGWEIIPRMFLNDPIGAKDGKNEYYLADESRFLTQKLKVTYRIAEDNTRKASPKQNQAAAFSQRHPKFCKSKLGRWLMRHRFSRWVLIHLFAPRKKASTWPAWVAKTDEERVQNMPHLFLENSDFQKMKFWWTEKIDGTSTTFTMRQKGKKLIVASRNVVFERGKKEDCFYESNVYLEMADKYDMQNKLKKMLTDHPDWEYVTIQGETFGAGIQKRTYGLEGHGMMVFNVIVKVKGEVPVRFAPNTGEEFCNKYGLPFVPVLDCKPIPKTCDETIAAAAGPSQLDGLPREGIVFRDCQGQTSFKAVDPEFILQYHG